MNLESNGKAKEHVKAFGRAIKAHLGLDLFDLVDNAHLGRLKFAINNTKKY